MTGALSSDQIAEVWCGLRDRGRPADQEEAASLASVHAPPSRALRKRIARGGVGYVEPIQVRKAESASTRQLRHQLDVKNGLIALLGGSRTVKSC